MNKQIHIRDFDGKQHAILAKRAKANNMSLSQYLRLELAKLAEHPSMEELGQMLKGIRPKNLPPIDWAAVIREGREEREAQIEAAISRNRPGKP